MATLLERPACGRCSTGALAAAAMVVLLTAPASAPASPWIIERPDLQKSFDSTALLARGGGTWWLAYAGARDPDLVYFAERTESGIALDIVDSRSAVGGRLALAEQPNGEPALAYVDSLSRRLVLATRSGTIWNHEEPIAALAHGGHRLELLWPAGGEPIIGFVALDGTVQVAHRADGAWTVEQIASAASAGVSLAQAPSGTLHAAWATADGIPAHAWHDGTAWQPGEVIAGPGTLPSRVAIAIAPDGTPSAAWHGPDGDLYFGSRSGGAWSVECVDGAPEDVGSDAALVFVPGGGVRIAYRDADRQRVKLARNDGMGWTIEEPDPAPTSGAGLSLAIDAAGSVGIAHVESTGDGSWALRLAVEGGSGWTSEPIDAGAWGAMDVDLAVAPGGEVTAVQLAGDFEQVRLVTRNAGAWTAESVLTRPGHLELCRVAWSAAGELALAVTDWWQPETLLLRRQGSSWVGETVEPVMSYDLTLRWRGGASDPELLYNGNTMTGLFIHHAHRDGGGWRVESIEQRLWSGHDRFGLAFTTGGDTIAAFINSELGPTDLRLARRQGGAWPTEIVPLTAGPPASEPGIAVDAAGTIWLAYAHGGLEVARRDSIGWQFWQVDAEGGNYTPALAIAPNGLPAVAYTRVRAPGQWDLRFARFDGAAWSHEDVDVRGRLAESVALGFAADGTPWIGYSDNLGNDLKVAHTEECTAPPAGAVGKSLRLVERASSVLATWDDIATAASYRLVHSDRPDPPDWLAERVAGRGGTGAVGLLDAPVPGDSWYRLLPENRCGEPGLP